MTLAQYLRILRAQWLLIAAVTVLGALGAALYAWSQTPVYSASAQMFVTTSARDTDISTLSQGSTFTQQRVKSYAAVIASPDVLQPVIDGLGLDETPQDLADRVTASSPLDTVLLDVTVTDTVPNRARDTANAVARRFTDYVGTLEVASAGTPSPVKITVTKPAVTPSVPDSPRTTLDLALGLLVGLGLGVGAAVLRDTLDQTIGTRHDAGQIVGAPVLSAIVDDPSVKDSPLIVHDAFSPRAEAFRQLRTNIRFLSVDAEVRSLVVTSSWPGEGKSTTSANLAIAMAQSGEKVVLIDADLRRPSIADMFLLPSGVGLTSVLLGDVPPAEAVQRWRDDLDLWVLASGPVPPNPSELIGSHRMVEIVDGLVAQGYMVIVDSPPLLPVTDATILSRITAGALVVVRVTKTRVDQLASAADTLRTAGAPLLGVLVNRVPKSAAGYYSYNTYGRGAPTKDAADAVGPHVTGPIAIEPSDRTGKAGRRRRGAHAPAVPAAPQPAFPPAPHEPIVQLPDGYAAHDTGHLDQHVNGHVNGQSMLPHPSSPHDEPMVDLSERLRQLGRRDG